MPPARPLTSDESARAALLVMAQKCIEFANRPPSQDALHVAVRAFNDRQMEGHYRALEEEKAKSP